MTALLTLGRIPNPFVGFNELKVQWIGEKQWTYKVTLPELERLPKGAVAVLAFDGLDTFATVKVNGEQILESDNMFIEHRVDVTKQLKHDAENVLEIDFDSALLRAREIQKQHPDHVWVNFNGEAARMAVRKNQVSFTHQHDLNIAINSFKSHWGWDWGPVLMTAGFVLL